MQNDCESINFGIFVFNSIEISFEEIYCRNYRKRYSSDTVKQLRKFEKLDYKVRRNQGDLEFLKLCQENGLTPKFLNFKLANRNLRYSNSYKQCQSLLLKEEIKNKVSIFVRQRKEFDKVKSAIQSKVSIFDFALCFVFIFGWG